MSVKTSKQVRDVRETQIEKYQNEPLELRSDFTTEQNALNGYRGRQILELLQNADDAASGFKGDSKILFDLTSERLVVANTGNSFDIDGLKSLVISGVSPKELEQNRFIGCKGLGFRCVLSWTQRPLVKSGRFSFGFCQGFAHSIVSDFVEDDPVTFKPIANYRKSQGELPAPVMRFPFVPNTNDPLVALAKRVASEGFQTVIVLPFMEGKLGEKAFNDASSQLRDLEPTSILFCRNLNELEIRGCMARHWTISRKPRMHGKSRVTINDGTSQLATWKIYRKQGSISNAVTKEGRREFETAVAVPEKLDGEVYGNKLCVYFPTLERLPCHAVLHATLETSDTRNHIIDRDDNREVLQFLGKHLVEVAKAETSKSAPLRGLEILAGIERTDGELKQLGFLDSFRRECKARRLFPTLGGEFASAKPVFRAPSQEILRHLDPVEFHDILAESSEVRIDSLLNFLSIRRLDNQAFKRRLKHHIHRHTPKRAGEILGGLIEHAVLPAGIQVDGLLIDQSNESVDSDDTCFSLPSDRPPELPALLDCVRFLNADFQAAMIETTDAQCPKTLLTILKNHGANIVEFKFEEVAQNVCNNLRTRNRRQKYVIRSWKEFYKWLMVASADHRSVLKRLDTQLITVNGKLARPSDCYLSKDYPKGRMLARAFDQIDSVKFAATPNELGLDGFPIAETQQFLIDLGVNAKPKLVNLGNNSPEARAFMEHVIDSITFPVQLRDKIFTTAIDLRRSLRRKCIYGVFIPEHFFEVVQSAKFKYVLNYLIAADLHRQDEYAKKAMLYTSIGNERKLWEGPACQIPNFARHWLKENEWIPCTDGKNHRPADIILNKRGSQLLNGIFFVPTVDPKDLPIQSSEFKKLMRKLGAIESLNALNFEQAYSLLLALPERDPDGEFASSIYRTLLDANIKFAPASSARKDFFANGKILVHVNGKKQYVPRQKAKYIANCSLPRDLLAKIPLLEIPRRKDASLVQNIFGVGCLDDDDISIQVVDEGTESSNESEYFINSLRTCLPYIYAMRLGRKVDDDLRERDLLKSIKLHVCRQFQIDATFRGMETSRLLILQQDESFRVGNELFVVDRGSSSAMKVKMIIANLVADLLKADIGSDVANILLCETVSEMNDVVEVALQEVGGDLLSEAIRRFDESYHSGLEDEYEIQLHQARDHVVEKNASADLLRPDSPSNDDETGPKVRDNSLTKFKASSPPSSKSTRSRKLVIRNRPKASQGKHQYVSGVLASEEKTFSVVETFERQEGGRWTIDVSHMQGSDALGCDLISVASEKIRDEFLATQRIRSEMVERFIEVKGSSQKSGDVVLTPNEEKAAEEHREKYFIYRVFVDRTNHSRYEIAILSDPLNSDAAHKVTKFDLSKGTRTLWYVASSSAK